ncbi:Heme peroxidase [Paenalcaligenes niemegkensis]|uniref:YqaJ viral recombinase family protein n=1 Tax=Paenalcaligenes niemegkensis TaxID=2895469 RepID=UPI001EE86B49|nr:YqaJ viral recombinase family protein [Paenalcaligenes niemegkensis]MCQ9618347.1 Heme peroxidase [Paenalcaligenes niemegkensis]
MMQTHQVHQGTDEWISLRAKHFTASEAPAMMGASSKVRRNELLHMKATGTEREFSDWVQHHLFDKGHEFEALARPIVEDQIGEELFPITGTRTVDGLDLLVSLDGATMLGETIFEHKMWNEGLAAAVRAGDLDPEYYWQLEQQLLVSKADKAIFVVSDGTTENFESMTYMPVKGRAEQLIAGWKQFQSDLETYVVIEEKPQAVGRSPDNLPALRIELSGQVTTSNLAEFKVHALEVLSAINRELKNDQDFADAEKTVKWCKEVEDKIGAAKEHALSQTVTIDQAFKVMDDVSEEVRRIRLELDRLIKAEKENIRNKIRQDAINDFNDHINNINETLEIVRLPVIECDVAGAMKGKRTLATLEDAAQTAAANAKIEATQLAEKVIKRLELITELGVEHPALFPDKQQLVQHDDVTLRTLIDARITQHKAKLEADAKAVLESERAREAANAVIATAATPLPAPTITVVENTSSAVCPSTTPVTTNPIGSTPPELRLGQIGERLGFTVTAEFLRYLGFEPAGRDRAAVLYQERDFDRMCVALIDHIDNIRAQQREVA